MSNRSLICDRTRVLWLGLLLSLLVWPAKGQISVVRIACGSTSAIGNWSADQDYSGGGTGYFTTAVSTAGVADPAPATVYQYDRYGYTTYTIPNLTPAAPYTVRLHFAETVFGSAGAREFNVAINGVQVLTNFDIFATAGGANKAVVEQFVAAANASGQITVYMSAGAVDGPMISGIEILTNFQVSSGGSAVGTWTGDEYYSGGGTASVTNAIDTSAANSGPQNVYQTQRYGYATYTIPNLTPGAAYNVRLHFAEIVYGTAQSREFNAAINGTQVLTNFDIVAQAGGPNIAVNRTFSATANSSGQIVIYMSAGAIDAPVISGIEVLSPITSYKISGQVTSNGTALAGVTMSLTGSQTGTTATDSNGNYSLTVAAGGSYVVTPTLSNYTFTPASQSFSNVQANVTQSFTATLSSPQTYKITGQVISGGVGVSGVTMNLSGSQSGTTATDSNGNYSLTVGAGGSYVVTPSATSYIFTPASHSFSNVEANATQAFTATSTSGQTYKITGQVAFGGTALPGVTMTLSGSQTGTTATDINGNYTLTVAAGGSYVVTPSGANYIFFPAPQSFNNVQANATGSFTASLIGSRYFSAGTFTLNQGAVANLGPYGLAMQSDGNLVLYQGSTALWSSGVGAQNCGSNQCHAVFQSDGNFVVYNGATALWSSNTGGNPSASFVLSAQFPQLQVLAPTQAPYWSSTYSYSAAGGFSLAQGSTLNLGGYTLEMQSDGNLVLYQGSTAVWNVGTGGHSCGANQCYAVFQPDGNFVVYDGSAALWSSNTANNPAATLILSAQYPELQIVSSTKAVLWADGPPNSGQTPQTLMVTDLPTSTGSYLGTIPMSGWALDTGSPIRSVAIAIDGVSQGNATYGAPRSDVCQDMGFYPWCLNVGWNISIDAAYLSAGAHTLIVTATTNDGRQSSISTTFHVTAAVTTMAIDVPAGSYLGPMTPSGWAVDNADPISSVSVSLDGASPVNSSYGSQNQVKRSDVCAAGSQPGCPYVEWVYPTAIDTSRLTAGTHNIVVTAVTSDGRSKTLSQSFTVQAAQIQQNIEAPTVGQTMASSASFGGWAYDTGYPISSLTVLVDGVAVGNATYGLNRTDVCTSGQHPGCPYVGWSFSPATITPGSHTFSITITTTDGRSLSTTPFSFFLTGADATTPPKKEYIYLNGKPIAIENHP